MQHIFYLSDKSKVMRYAIYVSSLEQEFFKLRDKHCVGYSEIVFDQFFARICDYLEDICAVNKYFGVNYSEIMDIIKRFVLCEEVSEVELLSLFMYAKILSSNNLLSNSELLKCNNFIENLGKNHGNLMFCYKNTQRSKEEYQSYIKMFEGGMFEGIALGSKEDMCFEYICAIEKGKESQLEEFSYTDIEISEKVNAVDFSVRTLARVIDELTFIKIVNKNIPVNREEIWSCFDDRLKSDRKHLEELSDESLKNAYYELIKFDEVIFEQYTGIIIKSSLCKENEKIKKLCDDRGEEEGKYIKIKLTETEEWLLGGLMNDIDEVDRFIGALNYDYLKEFVNFIYKLRQSQEKEEKEYNLKRKAQLDARQTWIKSKVRLLDRELKELEITGLDLYFDQVKKGSKGAKGITDEAKVILYYLSKKKISNKNESHDVEDLEQIETLVEDSKYEIEEYKKRKNMIE